MNLNQMIVDYYNKPREHQRVIGRYSATDIYKIRRHELTPENFFDSNDVDQQGVKNIFRGVYLEDGIKDLLDKIGVEQLRSEDGEQLKVVWDIEKDCVADKDTKIQLVMKPDFVIKNDKGEYCILETKCPNKIKDTVPPWYQDQLECQYRMLGHKVYMTVINIQNNDYPLLLHIPYKPSDVRWSNIKEIIKKFDKEIKLWNH